MKQQISLIVLGILLLILIGCRPEVPSYGEAIAGTSIIGPAFNTGSNDLRDFPEHFLTVEAAGTVTFRADILATSDYDTEVTSLRAFIKSRICTLIKAQNFDCIDAQGNQITGGAVAAFNGESDYQRQLDEALAAANQALQDFYASLPDETTLEVPDEGTGSTGLLFGPHLKCYNITEVEGPEAYPIVKVEDQFGTEVLEIIKPRMLCTPADKQPITKAGTAPSPWVYTDNHFKCYDVNRTEDVLKPKVQVMDQFGAEIMDVLNPEFLCAPAAKWHDNKPRTSIIKINFTNHYKCYNTSLMSPEIDKPLVYTEDQFGNETLRVHEPLNLCTPSLKESADPDLLLAEIEGDHLKCYNVSVEAPLTTLPVQVWDQFGISFIELKETQLLCTPALKEVMGPPPEPQPPQPAVCGNGVLETGEQCEIDADCAAGDTCVSCQCVTPAPPTQPGYTPVIPTRKDPTTPAGSAVAIGTCEDNTFIKSQLGTTKCDSLREGDALIQLTRSGNYVYLILAGKTKADAQKAAAIFLGMNKWELQGRSVDIYHNEQVTDVGFLKDGTRTHTLEYQLKEGKNVLGSPYRLPDHDIDDLFDDIMSDVRGIFKYDHSLERKVKWRVFRPNVPSDLRKWGESLEAYRILMKDDATLFITNALERSPARDTVKSEFIGYTPSGKKRFSEAFGNEGQYVTDIACWKNGKLEKLNIVDDPILDIGMGCFVKFSREVEIS